MNLDDQALPAEPRSPGAIPRLRASWRRSARYGLTADEMRPVFTGSVDTDSLLYECGSEVLRGLQNTLANEPVSMMITDPDGLVLSRITEDTAIDRSLDSVHLAPGFYFSERNVGTNGLGLALADRAPSLVRADEHYCTGLRGYTCAAAPVVDPAGDVAGSVNLTTWSDSAPELLLALAQSAAASTSSLMLARGAGRNAQPTPQGEVFRVYADRTRPPNAELLTPGWRNAFAEARSAFRRGLGVAVVGEPGTGKTALASLARRELCTERVLSARPPTPEDVEPWWELWVPELGKDSTCVIVSGVDRLPAWAVSELAALFGRVRRRDEMQPYVVTAGSADELPEELRPFIDVVIDVPALRFRPDDIVPLATHFATQATGRDVDLTPAAARTLTGFNWPDNVRQLRRVAREAAARSDRIDLHHLAPEVFTGPGRPLSRLQSVERDEIVRCLTEPGTTMAEAAHELGLGRATIYRKIRQYRITVPGRTQAP